MRAFRRKKSKKGARLPRLLCPSSHIDRVGGACVGGAMELEQPKHSTSKYKAYTLAVDKALKAFENTNEWADLISALAKLAKVFQSNSKFGDIPKPVLVAKRLSQCLHPALPMGVHLKALETYRQLFDLLGGKTLPRLLYLFAVGLFPLMDHCGIKVKSELLSIFELYLLPLGGQLRPALPGFLAAVLLGLEEGTEFFPRSMALLDRVCEGVGASQFYACLWQAVLCSPPARLPALIYTNSKMDKSKSIDEQAHLVGDSKQHMVAALCAAAEDAGSPLVQRNLLDLLCAAFPLDTAILPNDHYVQLLRRCLFVVLRRDMSLNRRLYQWLLNPSASAPEVSSVPVGDDRVDVSFFDRHALPLVEQALQQCLEAGLIEAPPPSGNAWGLLGGSKESEQPQFPEVRCCRLLLYLQDRPELGRPMLDKVLPRLLVCVAEKEDVEEPSSSSMAGSVWSMERLSGSNIASGSATGEKEHEDAATKQRRREEMTKTFNMLMGSLESGFLWIFIGDWFDRLITSLGSEDETASNAAAEHIVQFPKVVSLCINLSQLDSSASVRGKQLPRLLCRILGGVAGAGVSSSSCSESVRSAALTASMRVAALLLEEVGKSQGASEGTETGTDAAAVEHTLSPVEGQIGGGRQPPPSPSKTLAEYDQSAVEECVSACADVLATACKVYCSEKAAAATAAVTAGKEKRGKASLATSPNGVNGAKWSVCSAPCSPSGSSLSAPAPPGWPLLSAAVQLLTQLADLPLFCSRLDETSDCMPSWVRGLLDVIDVDGWTKAVEGKKGSVELDWEARCLALELLTQAYIRSSSVLDQHEEVLNRPVVDQLNESHTVLLKPMLRRPHLVEMDRSLLFEKCGVVVWRGVGGAWSAAGHQRAARLLLLLHSRRPEQPSSDLEAVIVRSLTASDQVECASAARTLHRVWALTRHSQPLLPALAAKPFNRAVMVLLGVLADESVSCARTELRSVAAAWFADCAKHNDLPYIVQMLSTMLMNPVTARISIQYVRLEKRLSSCDVASLPHGASASTLITADQRQRLYHLHVPDGWQGDVFCGGWQSELRGRLLASEREGGDASEEEGDEEKQRERERMELEHLDREPNFDDDTDSVDTLSLSLVEGMDPGVVETLQWLIDCVVDDEESEVDAQARFDAARQVVFRTGAGLGAGPSDEPDVCEEESEASEEKERVEDLPSSAPSTSAVSTATPPTAIDGVAPRLKKGHRRQDSLQESIFTMTDKEFKLFDASSTEVLKSAVTGATVSSSCSSTDDEGGGSSGQQQLHDPLHAHLLLYAESGRAVDLARAEAGFRILCSLLRPRGVSVPSSTLLTCLVKCTTEHSVAEGGAAGGASLVDLMGKHARAIMGQQFWSNGSEEAATTAGGGGGGEKHHSRHLTLLELLITISMHFLRSYFVHSPIATVSHADLATAWKCKIAALDFLCELLCELSELLNQQQSRHLAQVVSSVVQRSKLQKCLMHLLMTSVHEQNGSAASQPLSVSICLFNERGAGGLLCAYQRALLAVAAAQVRLEYDLKHSHIWAEPHSSRWHSPLHTSLSYRGTILRDQNAGLVELKAFLLTILNALKRRPERHEMWLHFVVRILPWMDRALPTLCVRVSEQLCRNIEAATAVAFHSASTDERWPANFLLITLETLTTLVHFCVGDAPSASAVDQTPSSTAPNTASAAAGVVSSAANAVGNAMAVIPGTRGATDIFSNIFKSFSSFGDSNSGASVQLSQLEGLGEWAVSARKGMLALLPNAMTTLCEVWSTVTAGEEKGEDRREKVQPQLPLGEPEHLRRLVLDLVCPLAQLHQSTFLSALSHVWLERGATPAGGARPRDSDQPCFEYTRAQMDIARLVLSLDVLPLEQVMVVVSDTVKETGASGKTKQGGPATDKPPSEAPLLELLHGCIRVESAERLRVCWASLYQLIADAPLSQLSPRALFLVFVMLCDLIRSAGASYLGDEKQQWKQMQDAAHKVTEAVNQVVGWQLETTTWLKRTLVVRHEQGGQGSRSTDASPLVEAQPPLASAIPSEVNSFRGSTMSLVNRPVSQDASSLAGGSSTTSGLALTADKKSNSNLRGSLKDTNNNKRDPAHSTQALFLLAEYLAELVDVVCRSDEKDKLLPALHSVWNNVIPYLRAKSARNARFFLASSQLLASMSSYSYMRPVWKKTTLELLLDSSFFRMDQQSLRQWLIVSDHLMTHDKTSFKDLLKSIAYAPNASFSLMTSKETEYEARAQALKRLAFVVLGSELDQYQQQLPDIQERLAENVRVCQSASIRSAVLLCYRVLLLRLRPNWLVSMWPGMLTELVHVLLQVQQQLSGDASAGDELASSKDEQWMGLYLQAAKLLETLSTLPAGYLAQFQMCQWAFASVVESGSSDEDLFVPFASRIHKLLVNKFGALSDEEQCQLSASLSSTKMLASFDELRPFFHALASPNKQACRLRDAAALSGSLSYRSAIARLQSALYVDFAEHWQL